MNQNNYTAILLKATDYRDDDKLVKLFTLEGGIITALLRGVKKSKAKLKFAAQPFAFCQYEVITKNGFNSVINASPIEDMFLISQDPDKFIFGSIMLELSDCAVGNIGSAAIFIYLLKMLKMIIYEDIPPNIVCVHYILKLLEISGYHQNYENSLEQVSIFKALFDIENLKSMAAEFSEENVFRALKRQIKIFEDKFSVKIKSATLI